MSTGDEKTDDYVVNFRVYLPELEILKCKKCHIYPQLIIVEEAEFFARCTKCGYSKEFSSILNVFYSLPPEGRHKTPVGEFYFFSETIEQEEQFLMRIEQIRAEVPNIPFSTD